MKEQEEKRERSRRGDKQEKEKEDEKEQGGKRREGGAAGEELFTTWMGVRWLLGNTVHLMLFLKGSKGARSGSNRLLTAGHFYGYVLKGEYKSYSKRWLGSQPTFGTSPIIVHSTSDAPATAVSRLLEDDFQYS